MKKTVWSRQFLLWRVVTEDAVEWEVFSAMAAVEDAVVVSAPLRKDVFLK